MQCIQAVHKLYLAAICRFAAVVDRAPADAHQLCLASERQVVTAVNHRLTLSKPALLSAACKKSFSKVS